jgi:hypothetical protein
MRRCVVAANAPAVPLSHNVFLLTGTPLPADPLAFAREPS